MPIIWLILLTSTGIWWAGLSLYLCVIIAMSFMHECCSTILINRLRTLSWQSGSTPLSNLWEASDWISYFKDFPIIASGWKYAHSIITDFVFFEQEVLFPPTTPARLMTSLLIVKTQFFFVRLIFLPSNVSNSSSLSDSLKTNLPLILFAS